MIRKEHLSDVVGALAGVVFAVTLFLGTASIDPLLSATDPELQAWWSDDGNRRGLVVSMYLWLIAAPCFLVFASVLRTRLSMADEDSARTGVVHGAGVVFAALLSVSAILRGVIAHAVQVSDDPVPGPDTLRYATELQSLTYGLGAMSFVTLAIAATSILVLRGRVLARWIGWSGLGVTLVSATLIASGIGPFGTPLILLWVLATSVHLFLTRGVSVRVETTGGDMARAEPQGVVPVL